MTNRITGTKKKTSNMIELGTCRASGVELNPAADHPPAIAAVVRVAVNLKPNSFVSVLPS